jgi:anti-sigma factor RsiW
MNCRELAELLIDFVAGELAAEQHRLVEQHLKECPPCVVYLQTYQITIRLTRQLPCGSLPPALAARLTKALDDIRRQQPPYGPSASA